MLHPIGAGALGPVFRAHEPGRDRVVALKVFRLNLQPDHVHRLVAELEALVLATPGHAVLATPLAAGIVEASAYLAQDLVVGDALDVFVREDGPMPPPEVIRVATELAAGLDHAASSNLLHGGLHPRDILMTADRCPRITGIGVVQALERVSVAAPARRPYVAPERAAGSGWDRRADVFSLAALAFELLWGRRVTGIGDQATEGAKPLASADLVALRQVFSRGLAGDPATRYGTARDFVDALAAAFNTTGAVLSLPVASSPKASRSVRGGRMKTEEPGLPLDDHRDLSPGVEPGPATAVVPVTGLKSAEPPEPTSSTVWPLVLALALGLSVGFAAGYGFGSREGVGDRATVAGSASTQGEPASGEGRGAVPSANPVVAAPSSSEKADAPSTAGMGRVVVRSTPAGARAWLDGQEAGMTPVTLRDLAPGSHTIRVALEGYVAAERRIVVTAKRPAQALAIPLVASKAATSRGDRQPPPRPLPAPGRQEGALQLDSRPAGASVFVDGRAVGKTPLLLESVEAGEHSIRLEQEGYRRWISSVRVAAGERVRVAASLEP